MRVKICLFVFSFLVFFPFFCSLVFGQNLLQNPGFEDGDSGWSKSGGTLEIDGSIYRSGNASAKFTNSATIARYIKQVVDLESSKQYKLEAFVKGGEMRDAQVWLRVIGGDLDVTSDSTSLPADFTSVSISQFDIPEGVTSVEIRAYLDPQVAQETIIAYFDDFSLEETQAPIETPTDAPIETPTDAPTPTPVVNDYNDIFISEFMSYPESDDEWVELHNSNNFEVDLYGWYVDDIADDGSSPKPISGIISPGGYKQFSLNSNAYLNNGGDDVRLLNGDQQEKDRKSFDSSIKGKSWTKDNNGNWCQVELTPNVANSDCPSSEENSSPTSTPTLTPTPTVKPGTPTPTKKLTPTATPIEKSATESGEILGEEATAGGIYLMDKSDVDNESTPVGDAEENKRNFLPYIGKSKKNFLSYILIGAGIILLGGAVAPFISATEIKKKITAILGK